VKQIVRQYDDGLDEIARVFADELAVFVPRAGEKAATDEIFVVGLAVLAVFLLGLLWLAAKEHALRADHAGASVLIQRGDDVLEENEVTIRERWDAVDEAFVRIGELVFVRVFELRRAIFLEHGFALGVFLGRAVEPPVFLGERKIGGNTVELPDAR